MLRSKERVHIELMTTRATRAPAHRAIARLRVQDWNLLVMRVDLIKYARSVHLAALLRLLAVLVLNSIRLAHLIVLIVDEGEHTRAP